MVEGTHVENPSPDESSPKKVTSTVLDTFRKLTHDKEKIRVKNGITLLKHLHENKSTENGVTELKYALCRLVRGLASSKNTSKIGFYSVLVALLNTFKDITVSELLDFAKKELHSSGKNSKSENADISSGYILLCGAIIRTGLFEKANENEQQLILQQLLTNGKTRTYLYLASLTFLINLSENLNDDGFKLFWEVVRPELVKPWSEQNIDTLYLFCVLQKKFPKIINGKFIQKCFQTEEIFCEEIIPFLSKILINMPNFTYVNHPIYPLICKEITETNLLVKFINEIDWSLPKLNYNRHYVVTNILINVLKNLSDVTLMPDLITKNYTEQTLQYFKSIRSSKKLEDLQAKVYELFDVILETLKRDGVDSDVKIAVLKKLLFYPGIFIFEKITRSKIVQQITATLDEVGVDKLAQLYVKVIVGEEVGEKKLLNSDRIYAAQLLVKLLGHAAMPRLDWKIEQLKILLDLGVKKGMNIGVDLAASIKETFLRALGLKFPKLKDLRELLSNLVHHLDDLVKNDQLRHPLNTDALESWQKAIELINKLESKTKKSHLNPVFHTLFLHMSFHLFNDVKLSLDSLKELFSCYEAIKKAKKGVTDNKIDWIEVVVDLFLNLLSHNSHLLRNLIGCVFPHLCKDLNATAVHQILDVLDPKNENNPLVDYKESDGSDDESDDNVTSDEETVNDDLRQAVQAALHNDDNESIDIDMMSESEGAKLDEALSEAFKQHKQKPKKKLRKQTKEDESLTHFRVRVLDLIDLYLDSSPSMLLCLEIMLPLLRLLEFCIKDTHQKPLCDRVRSCLHKLTNLKKFPTDEEVDVMILINFYESLLQKGKKSALMAQEMGDKIANCCVFVVRYAQFLNGLENIDKKRKRKLQKGIKQITIDALESFFTKRDCVTQYVLFKNLLQINWDDSVHLTTKLFKYIFGDTRPFKRSQALELLKIFYSNHRLLTNNAIKYNELLNEHQEKLCVDVVEFFHKPEVNNSTDKYVSALFNLLSTIKQCPLKTDSMNWNNIGDRVREYRSHVTFSNDTKLAYNKLCRVLGIQSCVVMQKDVSKLVGNNVVGNNVLPKEKKVKNSKRSTKLERIDKKESQLLRMQSMSGGLTTNLFDKIDIDGIDDDDDVESQDLEPRKRKNDHIENAECKKLKIDKELSD